VRRGRWALVGDASGYLDAITGEGMSLAFHQAEALVACVDDLSRYPAAHRRICWTPALMIQLVLFYERRPWLRRRIVQALAREPAMFRRFLAVNDGGVPIWGLGLGGLARLGWRIARAG
jgi:flavin-dependent dehydrogenase